ncbi:MAG: class I SAM-dependent methyltransferase [Burkholderiales bacterium]
MQLRFKKKVINKYNADYHYCEKCGYLSAYHPTWLDEAYSSAIASTDTGLVMRNTLLARKIAALLYFVFNERGQGRYLDAAGGYGMLTRQMRDYGFDFLWSDKYCDNLLARGFESGAHMAPFSAVTAIEVMEHLVDPVSFVQETLANAQSYTFIFTTELFEGAPPDPDQWWYYSFETGQHIAFYQRKTLEALAQRIGLNFYSAGGIHIFTKAHLSRGKLNISVSRFSLLLAKWAQHSLGSKLIPDHQLMVERSRIKD